MAEERVREKLRGVPVRALVDTVDPRATQPIGSEYGFRFEPSLSEEPLGARSVRRAKQLDTGDPNQIKSTEQLGVGAEVRFIGLNDRGEVVPSKYKTTITGEPEVDERGTTWVSVTTHFEFGDREGRISLSDHNVKPYQDGTWNPQNWLVLAETQ